MEEAYTINKEDIINALDGLPENKIHCSNLGVSALRKAIIDYYDHTNIGVFLPNYESIFGWEL